MHRKVRKKKTSKLTACSSHSKKRTSHLRMSREKRRSRTKCKTPRSTVSSSAPDSASGQSRSNCQKKSQLRKKEREWRRNAIDPQTLPSPQFDIPRRRSVTAWDEHHHVERPISTSALNRSQKTYDLTPRRGRSRGPPDGSGTPPLPRISAKTCRKPNPIAALMERIKSIHVPGRPYPDTTNMEVLGHELKLRLATRVPFIRGKVDNNGLFHFTESPAESRRHVTMYDITDDDDIHKACDVRVPKPSPAALILESMLRENRTKHQAVEVDNNNCNNNCGHRSTDDLELGIVNIDGNSASPVTGRVNCQVM